MNIRILTPTLAVSLFVTFAVVVACGGSDDGPASTPGPSGSSGSGGGSSGDGSSTPPEGTGGGVPGPGSMHAGCRIFPNDNAWNTDVSSSPVDTELMTSVFPKMAQNTGIHPDWGTVTDNYGFPITVGKAAALVPITFDTGYGPKESDQLACPTGGGKFCYPIPLDAKTEGGGDSHILFLSTDGAPEKCVLYELFAAHREGDGFNCGSSAIWKLDSNALRPEGWTSADAAGLPILAGLVRREEVERGEITHALRFTMDASQNGYIHPGTHAAGDDDATLPPMGLRVRLKASFSEAGFTGPSLVVLKAMKKYGMILADNGSDWYVSGEMSEAWGPDMDDLVSQLRKIKGSDFEIVKTGTIVPQPD